MRSDIDVESRSDYVLIVEYTGRIFRDGKAVISAELSGILERIGSTAESWWARIEKLSKGRLLGRFFAASRGIDGTPRSDSPCRFRTNQSLRLAAQ